MFGKTAGVVKKQALKVPDEHNLAKNRHRVRRREKRQCASTHTTKTIKVYIQYTCSTSSAEERSERIQPRTHDKNSSIWRVPGNGKRELKSSGGNKCQHYPGTRGRPHEGPPRTHWLGRQRSEINTYMRSMESSSKSTMSPAARFVFQWGSPMKWLAWTW